MRIKYYSEPDGEEFDDKDKCRKHELAMEAIKHLCRGGVAEAIGHYSDGETSGFLSKEAKSQLRFVYELNEEFAEDFFGNNSFKFITQNTSEFRKVLTMIEDIERYIKAAEKIERYIDGEPDI